MRQPCRPVTQRILPWLDIQLPSEAQLLPSTPCFLFNISCKERNSLYCCKHTIRSNFACWTGRGEGKIDRQYVCVGWIAATVQARLQHLMGQRHCRCNIATFHYEVLSSSCAAGMVVAICPFRNSLSISERYDEEGGITLFFALRHFSVSFTTSFEIR